MPGAYVYRKNGPVLSVLNLEQDYASPSLPHLPIQVRVHAASLNPVGYKTIQDFPSFMVKKPGVPEGDYSGVIIGGDLSSRPDLKVGDHVFGLLSADNQLKHGSGSLAKEIWTTGELIIKKPEGLSWSQAAAIPLVSMTAMQALVEKGQLKVGQRVLINGGTGGVGISAVQIAKALGAYVVATCSEQSFELVKSLGADEVINYKQDNLYKHLGQNYGSEDKRFDVIFDSIGIHALYNACPAFTKRSGCFVAISAPSGKGAVEMAKFGLDFATSMIRPAFLGGNPIAYKMFLLKGKREWLEQLASWFTQGKFKPIIDSEYSWEEVPKAYEKMMSGRAKGKIIVNVQ